jgi:hypothetical protein
MKAEDETEAPPPFELKASTTEAKERVMAVTTPPYPGLKTQMPRPSPADPKSGPPPEHGGDAIGDAPCPASRTGANRPATCGPAVLPDRALGRSGLGVSSA